MRRGGRGGGRKGRYEEQTIKTSGKGIFSSRVEKSISIQLLLRSWPRMGGEGKIFKGLEKNRKVIEENGERLCSSWKWKK